MATPIRVWAATGAVTAPDDTKISLGWVLGEKPPHEYMNWWMNAIGSRMSYILETGMNEWNSSIAYSVGSLVRRNGDIWVAASNNQNSAPPSGNWVQITRNASSINTGTLPEARLTGSYTKFANVTASGTVKGNRFEGSGEGVTNLNASALSSGSVPNERLTGTYNNIAHISVSGNIAVGGQFSGSGAGLTSLPAGNLTGTVANARMSGDYGFANLNLSEQLKAKSINVNPGDSNGYSIDGFNSRIFGHASGPAAGGWGFQVHGQGEVFRVSPTGVRVYVGTYQGDGSGLWNLDAGTIAIGKLSMARMPTDSTAIAWVGERYASIDHNGIGSTCYLVDTLRRTTEPGQTRPGSQLAMSNAEEAIGTSPPGTWMCCGYCVSSSDFGQSTTAWRRVA